MTTLPAPTIKRPESTLSKPALLRLESIFAALFGGFLGLALLKFGNPPIMEKFVTTPTDAYELVLGFPWPISWAYAVLGLVSAVGLLFRPWRNVPKGVRLWVLWLPVAWFAWQLLAATHSIDPQLTFQTVWHFVATLICFYLGFFVLHRVRNLWPFWIPILLAFLFLLAAGWAQKLGGLEETRRYFFMYIYPQLKEVSPEYLKKMSSNRIFATMFYPNALAGALLLLVPPLLAVVCRMRQWLTIGARGFLAGAILLASASCLYWSGSKGGWLLALLLVLVVLLKLRFRRALKKALLATVLVAGLAGFFWKYSGFFERGATSVSARVDYWAAAATTVRAHPLLGSGPGTFGLAYAAVKKPESEPARLAHNDYLEQASDSGLPGFLLYTGFISAGLFFAYRRQLKDWILQVPAWNSISEPVATSHNDQLEGWQRFAVYLGVLGFYIQGLLEFGLYLPALAWPAFTLLGWLLSAEALPVHASSARSITSANDARH